MKALKTAERAFGPFRVIDTHVDHWLCDGNKLPFAVVGLDAVIVEADTIVWPVDSVKTLNFINNVIEATQVRLDTFAQTRNYSGILSACTYATSGIPKFASEGQYCVNIRDQTWSTLYTVMAEVELGTRPFPVSVQEVIDSLPAMVWPI